MFNWKFPNGYVCPKCGAVENCKLKSRKVYQCNKCHHQHSLTSQTIFASTNKVPFVAAVCLNQDTHPISMNMNVVEGFKTKEIAAWTEHHLSTECEVVSDGLTCFKAVQKHGCKHTRIITGGGTHSVTLEQFTWVNTMIANVKTAIIGVYHAIQHKHLPRYLAEFCYRFNRRFQLDLYYLV